MNKLSTHYGDIYLNGSWQPSHGSEKIAVYAAPTGEVIAQLTAADENDAHDAVLAARAAWPAWAARPAAERATFVSRIADALEQRAAALTTAISTEVGMPAKLASRIQVAAPIAAWRAYAANVEGVQHEVTIGHSTVLREPVGVVACITPWNYPLHQITAKLAAALMAGCTVVLKPSEMAPTAAYLLADAIHDCDLPPGVFNMVVGRGPLVGEALVNHPQVDMVSFTGSTAAGKRVAALAAGTVKRVSLELGGKSPSLIFDDADLAVSVRSTVNGCFLNSGQSCSATTRMLVPASRYEEAVKLAVGFAEAMQMGDPLDPASKLGPLASLSQQARVRDYIQGAVAEGASIACGGAAQPEHLPAGYFVTPTVLTGVKPHFRVAQEEVFGPVLCIMSFEDEDDAVAIANGTPYGLAASVWTADLQRAQRIARKVRAGQIDINGAPFNLQAPFGGFAQSGLGRENGPMGLEEFQEVKSIQTAPAAAAPR